MEAMKCQNCGYENNEGDLTCSMCGFVLKRIPKEEPIKVEPEIFIKPEKKTNRLSIWIILGIIIIISFFIFKDHLFKETAPLDLKGYKLDLEEFADVETSFEIDLLSPISGMSFEEIVEFRKMKVDENSYLNIYPKNYEPLNIPHKVIYYRITPFENWTELAEFYLRNPYLLIVIARKVSTMPLRYHCESVDIKYSFGKIEETISGTDAKIWFDELYKKDQSGIMRIWMINAHDAGFLYIGIDKQKSKNIDYSYFSQKTNIINSPYANTSFYHVGQYGENNLSRADPNGRIKLISKNAHTIIYIKLWRDRPKNYNDKEDFAYIINVIP